MDVDKIHPAWYISTHHNWHSIPKSDKAICEYCHIETKVGIWDIPKCSPKYVTAASGYEPS
jgi:hypothetical protein